MVCAQSATHAAAPLIPSPARADAHLAAILYLTYTTVLRPRSHAPRSASVQLHLLAAQLAQLRTQPRLHLVAVT